jgi:hypothetical protein
VCGQGAAGLLHHTHVGTHSNPHCISRNCLLQRAQDDSPCCYRAPRSTCSRVGSCVARQAMRHGTTCKSSVGQNIVCATLGATVWAAVVVGTWPDGNTGVLSLRVLRLCLPRNAGDAGWQTCVAHGGASGGTWGLSTTGVTGGCKLPTGYPDPGGR